MRRTASPVQVESTLPFLSDSDRLAIYNLIVSGCHHLWSKNKLQEDRLTEVLHAFVPLTTRDPFFLAHLTSYILTKSDSKDLQVVSTYVSSLSSADGTPFSPGSSYMKPALRYIGAAALQRLDPKLVARVAELANRKYAVDGVFNEAQHFPSALRTAFRKYLAYREANLDIIRGIKKAGLGRTYADIYRLIHVGPSDEVAAILRWQQRDKKITFAKKEFDFEGKTDLEIAKEIRKKKLPVLGVLGALKKVSPVIAVVLLEQCSGNQAVILRKTFEDAGVLNDPEVLKLYEEKVVTAKTALDRVETLTKDSSKAVKEMLEKTRASVRKEQVGDIGKIFIHLDVSPSMETAVEVAREKGAIIAECVKNPEENFSWAAFDTIAKPLPKPEGFVKDAFLKALFGLRVTGGGTNVVANYEAARRFGADVDVIISDGGHNAGSIESKIREYHESHPDVPKPKACVHVVVASRQYGEDRVLIKQGYEANGIPVSIIDQATLDNSALVTEAVRTAMLGPVSIINTIMETDLLALPNWWFATT